MSVEAISEPDVEVEVPEPQTPEHFRVHDDATANWVVRQIVERRAYARRCTEWCDREQARAKHEEDFFLFRFGSQLMDYARRKVAEHGGRRKSVALPAGTVGFRSEPMKVVVDDENAVIGWAKQHNPSLVCIIEKLSKLALNEHLATTGEIPGGGAHIEPAREKFYVK